MKFVVLTGLSGAGKTQALHALEDLGFYCVDNLPPMMIKPMVDLCLQSQASRVQRVAIVVDGRAALLFGGIESALAQLPGLDVDYEIVFLDASDEELARRYNETRRSHPFGGGERIIDAIRNERASLEPLRESANRVMDTTRMLPRELRASIVRLFSDEGEGLLRVTILSFGFKRGAPQDADLVFDVRFLPNPFYIPEMRALTGLDEPVAEYIRSFPETAEFTKKASDLLQFLLPLYIREGKSRLLIAVGCTGGQHRSVLLTEEVGRELGRLDYNVTIVHRDLLY